MVSLIAIGAVYMHNQSQKKIAKIDTLTLPDVDKEQPNSNDKVYYLAYVDKKSGELVKLPDPMNFAEALAIILGEAQINQSLPVNKKYLGIYTENQAHAKALAVATGVFGPPEVHNDGYYGHYHDIEHRYHIWFENPVKYN